MTAVQLFYLDCLVQFYSSEPILSPAALLSIGSYTDHSLLNSLEGKQVFKEQLFPETDGKGNTKDLPFDLGIFG